MADTTYTHFDGDADYPQHRLRDAGENAALLDIRLDNAELVGRDANFFEWSAADISITEATMNWRPTQQLRVPVHVQRAGLLAAQRPLDRRAVR